MTRFRYSPTKFWISLIVALGLTAMVTGLTWMIFTRQGNPATNTITATTGLVFLAFFSVRMAYQYFRDDVVLAILPTGISDVRWGRDIVEWVEIKEITLRQRETNFELIVHLWPAGKNGDLETVQLPIDLDALESNVDTILAAITNYIAVRHEY